MGLEFDSADELRNWVTKNTNVDTEKRKWILTGANEAIKKARRDGARIYAEMQKEAASLGIPENIVATDLADFVDEFHISGQGGIQSIDGKHTLRTFLSSEQVNRPHWKTSPTEATKTDSFPLGRSFETDGHNPAVATPGSIASLFET